MLKHEVEDIDLYAVFESFWPKVEVELCDDIKTDIEVIAARDAALRLDYPSQQYPSKISSFNLDKNPVAEGRLDAIKGQYLIFDCGVINIRKYGGYLVKLESMSQH